jgi:hypothetical protein
MTQRIEHAAKAQPRKRETEEQKIKGVEKAAHDLFLTRKRPKEHEP